MRWLIFYLIGCLLLPLPVAATEERPDEGSEIQAGTDVDSDIRDEDTELIAELELIELLELLENLNALASMEDTE